MAQSLANVALHLVFSVKHRERYLDDAFRDRFHAYTVGTLQNLGCPCIEINSEPDHVHILCTLSRTLSIADLLEKLKSSTSGWIKKQGNSHAPFHWQGGYAAFSVSQSQLETVRRYIQNQQNHHRGPRPITFQDELRLLLRKHNIDFEEQYIWD